MNSSACYRTIKNFIYGYNLFPPHAHISQCAMCVLCVCYECAMSVLWVCYDWLAWNTARVHRHGFPSMSNWTMHARSHCIICPIRGCTLYVISMGFYNVRRTKPFRIHILQTIAQATVQVHTIVEVLRSVSRRHC